MGWVELPPYFTALTDTACDLANAQIRDHSKRQAQPHRLENVANTPSPDNAAHPPLQAPCLIVSKRQPVVEVDVYHVDGFLLLAQTRHQQEATMRAALHAIDDVFRPLCHPTNLTSDERSRCRSKRCSKEMPAGLHTSASWGGIWIRWPSHSIFQSTGWSDSAR
jgi:hypothetical protein